MKAVVQHYKDMLPSLGLYVGDDNIIRMGGGEMGKLHDFMWRVEKSIFQLMKH